MFSGNYLRNEGSYFRGFAVCGDQLAMQKIKIRAPLPTANTCAIEVVSLNPTV